MNRGLTHKRFFGKASCRKALYFAKKAPELFPCAGFWQSKLLEKPLLFQNQGCLAQNPDFRPASHLLIFTDSAAVKQMPPSVRRAVSDPPCSSAIFLAVESPIPCPPFFEFRELSGR